MKCARGRLPTSGSEIPFSLQPWISIGRQSNNCYAYAVNDFDFFRVQKSTPGDQSHVRNNRLPSYDTVKGLRKRMLLDNPKKIYASRTCTKCRKGFYKIMMFAAIQGREFGDFHYYKQHSAVEYRVMPGDTIPKVARFFAVPVSRVRTAAGGRPLKVGSTIKFRANFWSHKRGWGTGPLLKDAAGKPIRNPLSANRSYPGLNYSTYGGSFCVKNKGIHVGKTYA